MQFMKPTKTKFRNRAGTITYHAIDMRGTGTGQASHGPARARKYNGPAPALWKLKRRRRKSLITLLVEAMVGFLALGFVGIILFWLILLLGFRFY